MAFIEITKEELAYLRGLATGQDDNRTLQVYFQNDRIELADSEYSWASRWVLEHRELDEPSLAAALHGIAMRYTSNDTEERLGAWFDLACRLLRQAADEDPTQVDGPSIRHLVQQFLKERDRQGL